MSPVSWYGLRPGDIMAGPIGGFVPGVVPVGVGQILMAPWKDRLSWRTWWRVRHLATVVQAARLPILPTDGFASGFPDGRPATPPMVGQAMPHGYEVVELGAHRWTSDYTFIRPRYTPGQATEVAVRALEMSYRKIPYGFLDYAAIPAHRLHLPIPDLDGYITAVDDAGYPLRVQCAQAVDAQLTMAGFHPYDDGRLPGDVYPSGLYLRLLELGPAAVIRPGGESTPLR
jgi:hypothetical protein